MERAVFELGTELVTIVVLWNCRNSGSFGWWEFEREGVLTVLTHTHSKQTQYWSYTQAKYNCINRHT